MKYIEDDYQAAIEGMTATACSSILARVTSLAYSLCGTTSIADVTRLTRMAGETDRLVAKAGAAWSRGDREEAETCWSRALFLMDIMCIDVEILEQRVSKPAQTPDQSSGRTG